MTWIFRGSCPRFRVGLRRPIAFAPRLRRGVLPMRKRLGRSAEWEMPSGLAADDHISWPAATRIARDQAWDAASGYSVGTRTDGKEKVSTACLSPRLAAPAR